MAAKTPYPAYELRVLLLLPDGGENALFGLRTAGSAFVAGWRRNALSGLMACFCRPDKRSAIRQFTKPCLRKD